MAMRSPGMTVDPSGNLNPSVAVVVVVVGLFIVGVVCGGEVMSGGQSVMVLCFVELRCLQAGLVGWLDGWLIRRFVQCRSCVASCLIDNSLLLLLLFDEERKSTWRCG